jgi:hypothetical protein
MRLAFRRGLVTDGHVDFASRDFISWSGSKSRWGDQVSLDPPETDCTITYFHPRKLVARRGRRFGKADTAMS